MKKIFSLAAIFFVSCQTTKILEKKDLPPSVLAYFKVCRGHDGGGRISMDDSDSLLKSLSYDWISNKEKWHLQATDAMGSPQLELISDYKKVNVSGRLAEHVPNIGYEDQYLTIKQYKIGIKNREVPCLLNFTLPMAWMQQIGNVDKNKEHITLTLVDDWRDVKIMFLKSNGNSFQEVCVDVSWSYYMGLSTKKLHWCNEYGKKKKAVVKGIDSLKLSWESYE